MSLASLTRTAFATEHGPLALWHRPGAFDQARPLLLTITSGFAPPDFMTLLPQVMGELCDVAIMRLPGAEPQSLWRFTAGGFAEALDEVLDSACLHRPVVLFGVGMGGVVALCSRAAAVRRVVAVEPLLVTGRLWPLLGRLRTRMIEGDDPPELKAFVAGLYGVTEAEARDVRYRAVVEALVPTDVLVGGTPLMPPRPLQALPSLVDEPERAYLGARPGVTLHVIEGAGHDLPVQAPEALRQVLVAACAEAARPLPEAAQDAALLAHVPLDARRVLYLGERIAAFAGQLLRRAPQVEVSDDFGAAQADVVVVEDAAAQDAAALAARLAPGGALVGLAPRGASGQALALWDAAPLSLLHARFATPVGEPFDDRAGALWPRCRGRLPAALPEALVLTALKADAPPPPPLDLRIVTFARRVLDVRTRLPAQALRSEPRLRVACLNAPANLPDLAVDAPKILLLQRPSLMGLETWRPATAESVRRGWVVVMEFDDHPELVAEVAGEQPGPEHWARFGYVHAVQTSTPALAAAFRAYNPEVKAFANAAFTLAPFPAGPRRPRVLYAAVNRGAFAVEVARSLGAVAEAFPEAEFVVAGDAAVFEALPAPDKRFVDYLSYEDYLDLMATATISLSPLGDRPQDAAKSDVKFVEAASRGALTIGSPAAYGGVVRHGENGLIAAGLQDWPAQLAAALADDAAREAMARRAWDEVRTGRMFAHQLTDRRAWYQSLWDRRTDLTEALIARVPGLAGLLGR